MLGFGALAEFPLLDFGDERQTTWLSLPAVAFSFAPFAVGLQAGRNLDLVAPEVLFVAPALAAVGGKSFGLPALEVAFAETVAGFAGGRHVALPAPEIAFGYSAIGLRAGKNIDLVAPAITVAAPVVGVQPGKLIGLPALDVLWDAQPLIPSPGKSFGLPSLHVALSYGTLRIETGRIFNLANTIFVTTDVGALLDGALGEFALGEGDLLTQETTRPVEFRFSLYAAGVQAGRNIDLTAPDIAFNAPVPEIAARHRKLRVLAIAS